jgi:hypothetical protein
MDFSMCVVFVIPVCVFVATLGVRLDSLHSLRFLARLNEGVPPSTVFHRSRLSSPESVLMEAKEGFFPECVVEDKDGVVQSPITRFYFLLAYLLLHQTDDPTTGVIFHLVQSFSTSFRVVPLSLSLSLSFSF